MALLVPFTSQASSLEFGNQGAAPRVHAIVVPVFIATVLLVHITLGARNAQTAAAMPALAGLFVGGAAALSPTIPEVLPASVFPNGPAGVVIAGLTVWLGALGAITFFHLIYRAYAAIPIIPLFTVAGLTGLVIQGAALTAISATGLALEDITWPAIVAVPIVVGLVPTVFIAVAAELRLHGLGATFRHELLRAPPFGSGSLVEEAIKAERLYEEGLSEGQASASTYLELVESDEEGAYVCDPDGQITYANKALAALLNRPGDDLTGESAPLLFGRPGRAGAPPDPADAALEPGTHRLFVVLPSGRKRAVELKVRRASDGRVHGHVSDLTGELVRRELERQKRRAEFYLDLIQHTIAEHVKGPLEKLDRVNEEGGLYRHQKRLVDEAVEGLEELRAFTRRIELLGKLESIEPVPIDAAALLHQVGDRFAERHADVIDVSYQLPEGPVPVRGAKVLTEVVQALLENAVRHNDRDTVRVTLGAERSQDGSYILSVEDDGPGLPPEVREALQRPEAEEEARELGLGLHVARNVVKALGGRLWVEDRVEGRPDEGTAIKIRLAAAPKTVGGWGLEDATPSPGEGATA